MKKIISLFTLSVLLILSTACNSVPSTLNTKYLTKQDNNGRDKNMPIDYTAPSTKAALKAIPFKLTLPKKLPFESQHGFQNPDITDYDQTGKKISVSFTAFSKKVKDGKMDILTISANNANIKTNSNGSQQVNLKNNIQGQLTGNDLEFEKDGIRYGIDLAYNVTKANKDQLKKDLIDLANQMI